MANKAKKWKQDVVTLDLPNYIRVECPFQLNWSRDELNLLRRGWWLPLQRGDQSFTVNETAKITRSGFIGWRWDAFYFHFQLIGNFCGIGEIQWKLIWGNFANYFMMMIVKRKDTRIKQYLLKSSFKFKNVIISLINTRLVHLLPPITIHPPCPTKCPRLIHSSTLSNASSTFIVIVSHGNMYFHFWFLNFDTIFPLPVTVSHSFKSTQVPDPPPLPPFPTRASSPSFLHGRQARQQSCLVHCIRRLWSGGLLSFKLDPVVQ